MVQRNQLRQDLRQQRNKLSRQQQLAAANAIAANIKCTPEFQHATSIGAYLANDGEISPVNIIKHAWQDHKAVYLPKVKANNDLLFARYQQGSTLAKNQYGILEPTTTDSVENMAVILVPLVGFDCSGNRLGMGGGYYDRYLASRQQNTYLIGLAHQCQQVSQLAVNRWDIPLNVIITDREIINC
jgi:5-formyltetrahydrofolate cyclo-ligase